MGESHTVVLRDYFWISAQELLPTVSGWNKDGTGDKDGTKSAICKASALTPYYH